MIFGTVASNKLMPHPEQGFYGQFIMADTGKHFKISGASVDGDVQYSSDEISWVDVNGVDIDEIGSTTWYVRQRPDGEDVTRCSFANSEFKTIVRLNTSGIINWVQMFNSCELLESVPVMDMSDGISFTNAFANCVSLTHMPAMDTSSGSFFTNMFVHCLKLECLTSINTSLATTTGSMFDLTPLLVAPNAAEQAQITQTPGIDWVNSGSCP